MALEVFTCKYIPFSFSHLEDAFVINELKIRNSDDFLLQMQAVEME